MLGIALSALFAIQAALSQEDKSVERMLSLQAPSQQDNSRAAYPPSTMASAAEQTLGSVLTGRAKNPGSVALAAGLRFEDKSEKEGCLLQMAVPPLLMPQLPSSELAHSGAAPCRQEVGYIAPCVCNQRMAHEMRTSTCR